MTEHTSADGRTTVDEFAIDPTEIEYEIKNSWKDSQNNRRNTLGKIDGTDIWVAYRTWRTGDGTQSSIKGVGRLSVEGINLDIDTIAENIRDGVEDDQRDNPSEWGQTDLRLEDLRDQAEEVAEHLADEWRMGAGDIVGDSIYEGTAPVDGTTAWASHVEEALYHETEHALARAGVEDDEHGRVSEVARSALSNVVADRRDQYRRPHLEYEANLSFEIDPWRLRALELEQNSVLKNKPELCKVQALEEAGHSARDIADTLDKHRSTVSRQRTQISEWFDRATWTVESADE